MGSYVQVIVGGMLLITAFLFGRYINDKPILHGKPTTELADSEEAKPLNLNIGQDEGPKEPTVDENSSVNTLQQSLRDRILGDRKRTRNQTNTESPKLATNSSELPKLPLKVQDGHDALRPDFSHLEQKLPAPKLAAKNEPRIYGFDETTRKEPTSSKANRIPTPDALSRPESILRPTQSAQLSSDSKNNASTTLGKLTTSQDKNLIPVRNRRNVKTTIADKYIDHTTAFGDTLHSLSIRYFGKPDYYLDIYLANKELFENPSNMPVNVTLKIPVVAELSRRHQ